MEFLAMAKINLALDVAGKRADGYHEVRMVMQSISLHDTLHVSVKEEPGIDLSCSREGIPTDSRNLAVRAAALLMEEFGIDKGLRIELEKQIPAAAGLAGGSADAAAAMRAVNHLFALGLSKEELMQRAVKIGADVPFCILGGTALAEGIGEILTPLPPLSIPHLLIAKPDVSVSTAQAYAQIDAMPLKKRPDIDGMLRSIGAGDLCAAAARVFNVFEEGICNQHPEVGEIIARMRGQGCLAAAMSGSGPTVFGIFEDEGTMKAAERELAGGDLCRDLAVCSAVG